MTSGLLFADDTEVGFFTKKIIAKTKTRTNNKFQQELKPGM